MKNLIVERVVAAFRKNSLLAIQEDWGVDASGNGEWVADKGKCCCGIGAILVGESCLGPNGFIEPTEAAANVLGVSPSYVDGFLSGFDGHGRLTTDAGVSFEYEVGYLHGHQSWEELVSLGLVFGLEEEIEED